MRKDKSIVRGLFVNNLPNGNCIEIAPNGDVFDGTFNMGVKEGQCVFKRVDGSVYEGSFITEYVTDLYTPIIPHGQGHEQNIGFSYKGNYFEGKKQGLGRLESDFVYEGEFLNDLFHGKGKEVYSDSKTIEAEYIKGVKQGKGKVITSEQTIEGIFIDDLLEGEAKLIKDGKEYGCTVSHGIIIGNFKCKVEDGFYEGSLKNNQPNGLGTIYLENGITRVGMFKDGKIYGKGNETQPNNSAFIGDMQQDQREGYGILYYKDGSLYEGFFSKGIRSGYGYFKTQKVQYFGYFCYDKFHGYGILKHEKKYSEGIFVNGNLEGKGKHIDSHGNAFEGEFLAGEIVNGDAIWKNGNRYSGEFKKFKPDGLGHEILNDGTSYKGRFVSGKREGEGE